MTFNGTAALVTQRSLCTGTTFAIAAEAGIRRSDGGLLADGLRFLTAFGMTLALSCSRALASRGSGEVGSRLQGTTVPLPEAGIRRSDGGLLADGLRFQSLCLQMTLALSCSRALASSFQGGSGYGAPCGQVTGQGHGNDVCHCCGSRY